MCSFKQSPWYVATIQEKLLLNHFLTKILKNFVFRGMVVAQSKDGVLIFQRKYTMDILEELGLLYGELVDTPINPSIKLFAKLGDIAKFQFKWQLAYILTRSLGKLHVTGTVHMFYMLCLVLLFSASTIEFCHVVQLHILPHAIFFISLNKC